MSHGHVCHQGLDQSHLQLYLDPRLELWCLVFLLLPERSCPAVQGQHRSLVELVVEWPLSVGPPRRQLVIPLRSSMR